MATTFQKIAYKIQGSYMSIFFFLFSIAMLIIGGNHFVEDTLSSYYGIKMLELHFGLVPATYPFTYFTLSILPQVAQVVFFYVFVNNPRESWWAFVVFAFASLIDFYTDVWYRSDQEFWSSPEMIVASTLMTFFAYTFGSELFLSTGFGLAMELFAPAIKQFKKIVQEIKTATGKDKQKNTQGNQSKNIPQSWSYQSHQKNRPKQNHQNQRQR